MTARRVERVPFLRLASFAMALAACSGGSTAAPPSGAGAAGAVAGTTCMSRSECAPELECVFVTPGCNGVRGTCTRVARVALDAQHSVAACSSLPGGAPRCMCDGTEVPTSCPAFAPFVREGACPR